MEQLENALRFKKLLNVLTVTVALYLGLVVSLIYTLDKSLKIYFWVLFWLLLAFLVVILAIRPFLVHLDLPVPPAPRTPLQAEKEKIN